MVARGNDFYGFYRALQSLLEGFLGFASQTHADLAGAGSNADGIHSMGHA